MTRKIFSFTGRCHLTGEYNDRHHDGKPFCLYSHWREWHDYDPEGPALYTNHKKLVARFPSDSEMLCAAANVSVHGHI